MENTATTRVLIGIQARSTSQRLPGKCFAKIGEKRLLDHVLDACNSAANYSNRYAWRKNYHVDTALLVPFHDPIIDGFSSTAKIVEGPEFDVLERYRLAAEEFKPHYICRITGDCPLIPPFVITKHISLAIACKYDYVSNVDEACRLSLDGIDCEVFSHRMLLWLIESAITAEEKEHVTLLARKNPPKWANRGFTASYFDQSEIKLSVDTEDDLERVRKIYENVEKKIYKAEKIYKHRGIHRF